MTTASELRVVARAAEVRDAVRTARAGGATVAFVPTMGALHAGHLSLLGQARQRASFVVLSIFVNPLQFGPEEDFTTYPRDPVGDRVKAAQGGADLLFLPIVEEMYPTSRSVGVAPGPIGDRWEGAIRPGHFAGVLTVVAKLLHLVDPDVAIFGQKDIQQAALVRAMVRDLDFPVDVVVAPTVREPDGLAMSSRNAYLGPDARQRAVVLVRALRAAATAFRDGVSDTAALRARGLGVIATEPTVGLDYFAFVEPEMLTEVARAERGTLAIVAARIGDTRLIDNMALGV